MFYRAKNQVQVKIKNLKNLVKKFIKTQNKVNQETEWKLKNSNIKILI